MSQKSASFAASIAIQQSSFHEPELSQEQRQATQVAKTSKAKDNDDDENEDDQGPIQASQEVVRWSLVVTLQPMPTFPSIQITSSVDPGFYEELDFSAGSQVEELTKSKSKKAEASQKGKEDLLNKVRTELKDATNKNNASQKESEHKVQRSLSTTTKTETIFYL